jgi:adenylate cyclase
VFLFIRFSGYSPETINIIVPKVLLLFWHNMPLAFVAGGLMGAVCGLLELYIFKTKWKHISFYNVLILRLLTYLISLVFITTLIAFTYSLLIKSQSITEVFYSLRDFIKSEHYLIISAYGLLISLTLFFFGQMNKKIGDGEIFNILGGKYHHPQEECRYFMFLDLEDSTHLASAMGHVKFSEMLQDVYARMSKFVIMYEATIYQHVGDEVVLTWRCHKKPNKPVNFFFDFEKFLGNKQDEYQKKYGFIPRFRA